MNSGDPLIVPVEEIDGTWRDRVWTTTDREALQPTRFRCAAFQAQADGSGSCAVHDAARPRKCGEFPVGGAAIEAELTTQGEVWLQTAAFARCSWSGICIVPDVDPRLT